jgi:L-seryl-tRNA(Ser) seleniumtransferase
MARDQVRQGAAVPSEEEVVGIAETLLAEHERSLLVGVINATGVLLHTNLGRAPLGPRQLDAVRAVAGGYSNLEFDLTTGSRGSRYTHASSLITALTGAQASLVVNNNAAAVLLALSTLCTGREVIISRGELVEIGGEFRIPDILVASGARLVEVGTTNRTHLKDYEQAITAETAAILKVHPSNYSISGFTSAVAGRDLARLTRGRKLFFIHDIGSGLVSDDLNAPEPTVRASLEDGADIVTFSGDKLLGGPQAGVIVGRAALIERMSKHPFTRAMRVDKMTLAALEETLKIYLEGSSGEIPLHRMATADADEVASRARSLLARLSEVREDVKLEIVPHRAVAGGGSMPSTEIASWALAVIHPTRGAAELDRALRHGRPPVVARVEDDRLLLDLRTVAPEEETALLGSLRIALT